MSRWVRPVRVICDPADSAGAIRLAARAQAHDVPVCRTTPEANDAQLARDVLRGLGKRLDLLDTPRDADKLWHQVDIWVRALKPPSILILRAHQLTDRHLARLLAHVAPRAQLALLIARREPSAEMLRRLSELGGLIEATEQIANIDLRRPPPAPRPRPTDGSPLRLPELPRDAFTLFLDACDRALDQDTAGRVAETVHAAQHQTRRWLEQTQPSRVGEAIGLLRAFARTTADPNEGLARIHGAQNALLLDGDLVTNLDAAAFVIAHRSDHRDASQLDGNAIALLRGYSNPLIAAVGVAGLATDLRPEALAELTVFDVPDDAHQLQMTPIPAAARPLLLAQRIARHDSPADHDALLTHRRDPRRASPQTIRGIYDAVARETGLSFRYTGDPEAQLAWAKRHTLTLEPL